MSRPHLKLLSGNYLTYSIKAAQSGGSPACRLCSTGSEESVSHVVSTCTATELERSKIVTEYRTLCMQTKNCVDFDRFLLTEKLFCQFILDPTSINLPVRISPNDPLVNKFFNLSRDFCHIIDKTRMRLLKEKESNKLGLSWWSLAIWSIIQTEMLVLSCHHYT